MPAPKNLWRQKNRPKFFYNFWLLSTLIPNISGKDQQIKNRKSSPPTLDEKKLVYFGPQTKKLLTLINLHPNELFSGDYILALRGCCALKFLHTLEIHRGLLAHTRRGTGFSCVLPLLREELRLPELILYWDLRRRAASRWALHRTSSYYYFC